MLGLFYDLYRSPVRVPAAAYLVVQSEGMYVPVQLRRPRVHSECPYMV